MLEPLRLKRRVAYAKRWLAGFTVGRQMASGPFARTMRELVALAWPMATAMAGETVMGVVDTKLVGGLGPDAIGGVGVAMTLVFLGYMSIFGLMRGLKVSVAHAVGEGRGHRGVRYAQAGVVVALVAGAAFWAITRDASPLLRAIGIAPGLVPVARVFLATFTLGAPASAVISAQTHYRQASGDSRTPMLVGLLGNAVNAPLAWALIYGHGGLPALGVRGAALATVTAETLEAIVLLAILARDVRRSPAYARARTELPLGRAIREIAGLGVPTGAQFASEQLAFATFTAVLGTIGSTQVAAHQIAIATVRASFLPGVAVSEAASVLVGQSLGRRSLADADRTVRAALAVAVTFMAGCGLLFATAGDVFVRTFTRDASVQHAARTLLFIASAFQVVDAVSIVLRGALRGAKDVRVPALIGVGVVWTCVPTAALLLGKVGGLGAAGGWCGFVGETTLGALLFAARWRRGSWRRRYARSSVRDSRRPPRATTDGDDDAISLAAGALAPGSMLK